MTDKNVAHKAHISIRQSWGKWYVNFWIGHAGFQLVGDSMMKKPEARRMAEKLRSSLLDLKLWHLGKAKHTFPKCENCKGTGLEL